MTLNEVGKLAGVSRMTVSRYFNGGYVSPESRARIEKVVKETGFQPSAQAKALKTKRTHTIGVIVSALESSLLVGIINHLHEKMEEKGYQILIMRYLQSKELLIQQIKNLRARGVDGLIVSLVIADKEIEDELRRTPIPVVTFGSVGLEGISGVIHDDQEGFSLLISQLKARGYREIGCAGPDFRSQMTMWRLAAIQEEMKREGLELHGEWFIDCKNTKITQYEMGRLLGEQYLKMKCRPKAVIAVSDQIAVGIMSSFIKAGVAIPGETAVCGYGNIEVGSFLVPSLTTIDVNQIEIVNKIASLLLEQIDKNARKEKKISVEPLLILRESI